MPDRKKAPALKEPNAYEVRLPACEKIELKNQVPLFYVKGGAEPVVQIEWVLRAGNIFENNKGVAAAVAALFKRGTGKKSAFEISRQFEFFGASFQAVCQAEYVVLSLETLSKYIGELLPLVRELLTDAIFPDDEFELYRQNSIQHLQVYLKKSDFVADREMGTMLFGRNNPYGKKTAIADLDKLSLTDIKNFYEKNYLDGDLKIFASGQWDKDFVELMEHNFGDLNIGNKKVLPEVETQEPEIRKNDLVIDSNGVQASIRIARIFPDKKHPDFQKALVLNTIFGGYFGSRLQSNIREDKGYTYGIYSYLQFNLKYTLWGISTESGKEVADAAISEVYKEMVRLTKEEVPEEELQLVRNYSIGRQLNGLDGPFRIMDWWRMLIMNDLDEKYFEERIRTIKTITPGELLEVAKKYLKPEDFLELKVV